MNLLMAHALNLDPNTDLQTRLPRPVLNDNTLPNPPCHCPAITYTPQTSTDLKTWLTDGVVISDLDANQQRTASIPLDAPRRYLRLVVSESL